MIPPIKLVGRIQRDHATKMIMRVPDGWIVTIKEPKRSLDQNARLWALMSDISKAQPMGRRHTPEDWKCIFMNACGWETQFIEGLDGRPFPMGFKSSQLTIKQMTNLIEYIQSFMAENGIQSSERNVYDDTAA